MVEQASVQFVAQNGLHGTLKSRWFNKSAVDCLLQILIVGAVRKIGIATAVDSRCRLVHGIRLVGNLVDGGVIAHHHSVESEIIAQNIDKYLAVSHTVGPVNSVVARHHHSASGKANHRLVRQQNLLHQLFLIGIATAAVAQIVLRASANALFQVVLLKTAGKGHAHRRRQVSVLAIRLLKPVERRRAAHIHHRRKRQNTTHLAHHLASLARFEFGQLGVERARLPNLLRINGGAARVDSRQHLFVKECGNAVWRVGHQPLLNGCHAVA